MVRFCVGFKFRTADWMGVVLWNVTPSAVAGRPTVGLMYTVLPLTLSPLSPSPMAFRPVFGS